MNPIAIGEISNFSEIEKLDIYMDKYCNSIALKYDFEIIEIGSKGWGLPDKNIGKTGLHFLWKNIAIEAFEEFKNTTLISEWYWKRIKNEPN